jgi:hypothetical protein
MAICEKRPEHGETIYEFAKRHEVPVELVKKIVSP